MFRRNQLSRLAFLLPIFVLTATSSPSLRSMGTLPKVEVEVDGKFVAMDKAIVPTPRPTVRITVDQSDQLTGALLLRDDGRAGLDGAGKAIVPCLPLQTIDCVSQVSAGVYEGMIRTLVGVNRLRVATALSPQPGSVEPSMLNYTRQYEDLNGNGVLDANKDANGNGRLDAAEDVDGDRLLDFDEDQNGNGRLDVTEDLNGNGTLDPGEDFNANGVIDSMSQGPGATYPSGPSDLSTIEGTKLTYSSRVIELDFVDDASDDAISAFLRDHDLRPMGLLIDNTKIGKAKLVTVGIPDGVEALELVKRLNGLSVSAFPFFPDKERMPVDAPLEVSVPSFFMEPPDVAGEALPARLLAGAAALPSPGNAGDAYNAANGGFDNDNDGGANDFDELNIAWDDFFMQTFAAHRLVDKLVTGSQPLSPLIALIDTGLGNGTGNALVDFAGARVVSPTNCVGAACNIVGLAAIPDAWTAGAAAGNHGTSVAHNAAGGGVRVLGIGKDSNIRPFKCAGPMSYAAYARGLVAAAADPSVLVVVLEFQEARYDRNNDGVITNVVVGGVNELQAAVQGLNAVRASWLPGINALETTNPTKILIIPAGNAAQDTSFSILAGAMATAQGNLNGLFDAPPRGTRANSNNGACTGPAVPFPCCTGPAAGTCMLPSALVLGIGNSTLSAVPLGAETGAPWSNFGTRISVTSPGEGVPSLAPNQNFQMFGGTSGAAPQTAGLAGLLTFLDNTLANVGPFTPMQLVQLMEATADDLGTTTPGIAGAHLNDNAGDGPDNRFGYGRINAWKAALSAVNGGLADQHGRPAAGNDTTFTSLPIVGDAATKWYGFEIVTSERQATVWLDGTQLTDAGASSPSTPNIIAYKGVRSDSRIERGVHTLSDGSSTDPAAGGAPGLVVEEDPMTGIVPGGTATDDRGLYVMTFSVQRSDLYDGANPKTLSLRKRGAAVADKPFFNLRLNTAEMRTGRVSGVTFDDFVYQVVLPDYGDAAIAPTKMTEAGARHHNSALEWLGKLYVRNLESVTAEHNADLDTAGGDPRVDVDGVMNRTPGSFHDRDGRDDGVLFFPLTYKPGPGHPGLVHFSIGVADYTNPRYANADDQQLYVNLWIDWNANGIWEEANSEHVLDGVRINPAGAGGLPWDITSQGASGSATVQWASGIDSNSAEFESQIPVGTIEPGPIWARMRLDYGENVGRNDPRPLFRSLPSLRDTALAEGTPQPAGAGRGFVRGAARYGEVEDYLIGSDFGDAADITCSLGFPLPPNTYPTCKNHLGARHLDINKEWLGPDSTVKPSATREIDANDIPTDEDTIVNLVPEQTDLKDDGVSVPPLVPGMIAIIRVRATASIAALGGVGAGGGGTSVGVPEDAADSLPRYGSMPTRKLYISGWADWNGSGSWEPGEKIIDDIQDAITWGKNGVYTLGETFTDTNKNGVWDTGEAYTEQFGKDTKDLYYLVAVPPVLPPRFSLRFRLAYGEDENQTIDLEVREADEQSRNHNEDKGGALFGEVEDYLQAYEIDPFPHTLAMVTLIYPPGSGVTHEVTLTGPTTVGVDITHPVDTDGNGLEQVTTEMVEMHLTGYDPTIGNIDVHLRDPRLDPYQTTTGEIEESVNHTPGVLDIPPFVTSPAGLSATSFFNVYFEVNLVDQGIVLHNHTRKYMRGRIYNKPPGPGDTYVSTEIIPLYDANETIVAEIGPNYHIPDPTPLEGEIDIFTSTLATIDVRVPPDSPAPNIIQLTGPTAVNVNLPAIADTDSDGKEQVPTEMILLDLSGNANPFGRINVRLRPSSRDPYQRTVGEIEENQNVHPGVLDLPPFTTSPSGLTASSFFNVYLEVELPDQGITLHNHAPKDMSATIRNKPPAQGDTYQSPLFIDLFDANENLVARLGPGTHVPHPYCSGVACTPSDQCHVAGTCDPETGLCSNPAAPNGTTCNDGNACTLSDTCQSGVCVGSTPVTCAATDQCHFPGACNPATGTCSNPSKPNGSSCNDGNSCTQTDVCSSGTCAGAVVPDGTPCGTGICHAGQCSGPGCPIIAVVGDGSTSTLERAPNANFLYGRAVWLIPAAEATANGLVNGSVPGGIGFHYATAPGVVAVGSLKVYLQNTSDTTNTKSTTWTTAIAGMTTVHNAATSLPDTTAPFDVPFAGGSPFTYTGGGIYVAFDWQWAGPVGTAAVVACNGTGLASGLKGNQSNASPPPTVVASSLRPETRFTPSVPILNDASVDAVYALGSLPQPLVGPQTVSALITNKGANPLSNVQVMLNVSGAQTYNNVQIVPGPLAACGGQAIVTFAPFPLTALGSDTVNVTVPPDDVSANNNKSRPMASTTSLYSYKHPGTTAAGGVGVNGATADFMAKFTITAPAMVSAINLEFSTANATTYRAAVYPESSPGSGVPGLAPLYEDAADRTVAVSGPVSIALPIPVAVGPGTFFAGIEQTNTNNAGISFDAENPIRGGAFYFASPHPPTAWSDLSPGNNFKLNIGVTVSQCATSADCNDGNPCTADNCIPGTGCVHSANDGAGCSDNNLCTTTDVCQGGVCVGSNPVFCAPDSNVCTTEVCNPTTGLCGSTNNTAPCNDGNPCTTGDACGPTYSEGFDGVTAPSLPAGWTTAVVGTGSPWTTDGTSSDSAPNSAFGFDGASIADEVLISPAIAIATPTAQLTFRNRWTFEGTTTPFDGGALEISIGGSPFTDIVAAGGSFVSGGYTGVISSCCGNPLAGRSAWSGVSAGYPAYLTTVVNLPSAAAGQSIRLQWRIGTDSSVGAAGQNIDSIAVVDGTNVCKPGTGVLDCSDGNPCTDDACDPVQLCQHTNNTLPCVDGNECTILDTCGGGACTGTTITCDDGNGCTTDGCDALVGCVFSNNTLACDDGNPCTVGDVCGAGVCQNGTPITAPPEIQNLTASSNKIAFAWAPSSGATRYDVVRGSLGALPVGPGGADEVCFDNLGGPTVADSNVPATGTGFWYLSRGENTCGNGSFGNRSNGSQRQTTTCP